MGIWWAQLTHLWFFTEIPTPYELSLSRVDKCYLCHTLASCLAGMSPACWQSRPQWERCLCLRGGVRLGETKGAHSSEPPASRPSIPLSRRERRPRNVSQACREMATCSQSLGTLLPDVTHSSFCSCPTVALKAHRLDSDIFFFFKDKFEAKQTQKTCHFHTSCSLHFLLNNLCPSVSIAISVDRFPFLVFCAQLQIMTVFFPISFSQSVCVRRDNSRACVCPRGWQRGVYACLCHDRLLEHLPFRPRSLNYCSLQWEEITLLWRSQKTNTHTQSPLIAFA